MAQSLKIVSTNVNSQTVNSSDKDNQHVYTRENNGCGLGRCRPSWLQCCADIKAFTLCFCITGMMTQAISFYMISQITTIEKQFGLSSKQSGFLLSANDIGYVIVVLAGSHLVRNAHKPISLGVITIAFGVLAILGASPHFIMSHYNRKLFFFTEDISRRHVCGKMANVTLSSSVYTHTTNDLDTISYVRTLSFVLLSLTSICLGAVKAPRVALITTYIDDHVTKTKSGIYLGCVFVSFTLSAILAFGVGSVFSNIHVTLSDTELTPKDPRWVGAWWLGFVVIGTIAIASGLPILCFPKKLIKPIKEVIDSEIGKDVLPHDVNYTATEKNEESNQMKVSIELSQSITNRSQSKICKNQNTVNNKAKYLSDDEDGVEQVERYVDPVNFPEQTHNVDCDVSVKSGFKCSAETSVKSLKDFLLSVWRISSNPVYILSVLGDSIAALVLQGRVSYLPKYMESNFMIVASRANMLIGLTAIIGATTGAFMGGAIITCFKLSARGCYIWLIVSGILSNAMIMLSGAFKCEQPSFRGYDNSLLLKDKHLIGPSQIQCADADYCSCTDDQFMPVCGSDGNNYFSPCHAGCTGIKDSMFYNCSCVNYFSTANISNLVASTKSPHTATPGYCPSECDGLTLFLVVCFLGAWCGCSGLAFRIVNILRIVNHNDRSLAVGLNSLLQTLVGGLVAPILFGAIVDTSCVLWQGSCQLYDINDLRKKYHLFAGWIGFLSVFMYGSSLCVLLCSKKYANILIDNDMERDEQASPILAILQKKIKSDRKHEGKKQLSTRSV